LADNSTQKLVEDIEIIRTALGIERWMLFGGSWGSTLSLVYAEAHPERVLALILRGIFLCRQRELDWFYKDGASRIFPDHWQEFLHPIPAGERGNLMHAYYRHLTSDNELQMMGAAKAWSLWEGRCATLRPNQDVVDSFSTPHKALALARIEAHYFINQAFLEENQILRDAHRLQGIPGTIVHGRYDMICPLESAFALQDAWPDAELQIIRDAGHASREPGIVDALIRATDSLAKKLRPQDNDDYLA
jgi:proline iminopeptidase